MAREDVSITEALLGLLGPHINVASVMTPVATT